MNMMGSDWVVLGAFKLKEWFITGGYEETCILCHSPCKGGWLASEKTFPEMMDMIAAHRCPIIYGEEVNDGAKEALDK